ncbi:hypothetical protein MNBD_CHLOROFLEXI01-1973 [hydrothermal vent metagenome]|uniref:Haem-binding uptake Tiki superfamily ChaN domain-containing protein n=1 Tax=hydrothermal vent metagenome TaxID=652676 RepID=A0A3B0WI13_9ZZZZ
MSSTEVLILGTYHFANPGLDYVQTQVADVFSSEKQAEITAVLNMLATFQPTKIGVEVPYNKTNELNQLYQAYRSGNHQLRRSEVQQLGFRLAADLGHDTLFPLDHPGKSIPFPDAIEYAEKHMLTFATKFQQTLARWEERENRLQKLSSIREILQYYNSPKAIAENYQLYLDFTAVDAGNSYIGADVLAGWYNRNIYIFANLRRIALENDRILLIFGAGHLSVLRELVSWDANLNLINALDYL